MAESLPGGGGCEFFIPHRNYVDQGAKWCALMLGKSRQEVTGMARRLGLPKLTPIRDIKAAARYLGVHPQTLREMTDLGELEAKKMGSRRVYLLEELDRYIESLPPYTGPGGNPGQKGGES